MVGRERETDKNAPATVNKKRHNWSNVILIGFVLVFFSSVFFKSEVLLYYCHVQCNCMAWVGTTHATWDKVVVKFLETSKSVREEYMMCDLGTLNWRIGLVKNMYMSRNPC